MAEGVMVRNPFDINKAVDYTDEDLYKYWVNISLPTGFNAMVKPDTLMPMIIVGSKGSGKTHVMKFYSYELQKIRLSHEKGHGLKAGFDKESFIVAYSGDSRSPIPMISVHSVGYLLYRRQS